MSYAFTTTEKVQIQQALNACTGLTLLSDGTYERNDNAGTNAVPLYQTLSTIIGQKLQNPIDLDRATISDLKSAKLWLDVAIGANGGTGMHSEFIRTYTNIQGQLRLGKTFTEDEMQAASNAVARNVANGLLKGDIKSNLAPWTVPRIDQIAGLDASAIGETLFKDKLDNNKDTAITQNAAWSGTLGFNLLGGKVPFESWRLMTAGDTGSELAGKHQLAQPNRLDDFKNILFSMYAYNKAVQAGYAAGGINFLQALAEVTSVDGHNNPAPARDALLAQWQISINSGNYLGMLKDVAGRSPVLGSVVDVVSNTGINQSLDMLRRSVYGNGVSKTVSDNDFKANALAFFKQLGDTQQYGLTMTTGSLATQAKTDFTALVALNALSLFRFTGNASQSLLQKGNADLYAQWQTDQNLPADDDKGVRNFSDQWLIDRGKMLNAVVLQSNAGSSGGTVVDQSASFSGIYFDVASGTQIRVDNTTNTPANNQLSYIVFGSDNNDSFTGSANDDHLYGGRGDDKINAGAGNDYVEGNAGNDSLTGGAGNDTLLAGDGDDTLKGGTGRDVLKGGAGEDTYQFSTGDGADTVIDSDGQGKIVIDGVTLASGKANAADNKTWKSNENQNIQFTLIDSDSSHPSLRITYGNGDSILVKNYTPGAFGITLQDYKPVASTDSPLGNLIPIAGTVSEDGKSASYMGDDTGNLVVAAGTTTNSIHVGNGNNSITGGTSDDDIISGGGNSVIHTGGGYDWIYINGGGDNVITADGGRMVLYAGYGNNRIYGDKQVDLATALTNATETEATGEKGNFITVGSGDNTIVGGRGDDYILLANGHDVVIAGPGNDTIEGGVLGGGISRDWGFSVDSDGKKWLENAWYAEAGGYKEPPAYDGNHIDRLENAGWVHEPFGLGNATIFGGKGNHEIFLSNGNNYVDLGSGNSSVKGGMGNDTIFGGSGNVYIYGGGGDDYIEAESGNDTIYGGSGNNTIYGGSGKSQIFAGKGEKDWATSNDGNNYVEAGSGDTTIKGSGGNDTLVGGTGNDVIFAGAGDTTIIGGDGVMQIVGGKGNDVIYAGDGGTEDNPTQVVAGSGNTTIYGGDGFDLIEGGSGSNVLYAGDGGTASKPTQIKAGSGDTTIYGGNGIDRLFGGSGTNVIYAGDGGTEEQRTAVVAGSGDTTVYGGSGIDYIVGGSGTNVLYAGDGGTEECPTVVTAGSGNTTLVAGAGVNQLIGGAGQATYVLNAEGGQTTIFNSKSSDVIQFGEGISLEGLTVTAHVYDDGQSSLMIDCGCSVAIMGGLMGGANQFQFADGTTLTRTELLKQAYVVPQTFVGDGHELVFSATPGDSLSGGTGNDTIYGFGANDTLVGGTGNSLLVGGGGGAAYMVNFNSTKTVISNSLNSDTLHFDAGVQASDITAKLEATEDGSTVIVLHVGTSGSTVVIENKNNNALSQIVFANGSTATLNELLAKSNAGSFTTTNEDGSYSVTAGDGKGNITITQFDKNDVKLSDSWQKADGSSGSDTYVNGVLASSVGKDGHGGTITTQYNSEGVKSSDNWSKADGTVGSDIFNSDGSSSGESHRDSDSTSSSYTDDGHGNRFETSFKDSVKTGDNWTKSDGSHGRDYFNGDGSSYGVSYSADGTHSTYSNDGHGGVFTIDYDALGNQIGETVTAPSDATHIDQPDGSYMVVANDGKGNVTYTYYNSNGIKIADRWNKADGSYGNDYFNSDGSSSGVTYMADGSSSTYSNDGHGHIVTKYYDWKGNLTSSSDTQTDGGSTATSWTTVTGTSTSSTSLIGAPSLLGHNNKWSSNSPIATYGNNYGVGKNIDAEMWIDLDSGSFKSGDRVSYLIRQGGSAESVEFYDARTNVDFLFPGFEGSPALVHGINGTWSKASLGGNGNGSMTSYDASGNVLDKLWFHSDGSEGYESYDNGTKTAIIIAADGTVTTLVNGVIISRTPGSEAPVVSQPDLTNLAPPQITLLPMPVSPYEPSHGDKSIDLPGGGLPFGDAVMLTTDSNGSVNIVYTNGQGDGLSGGYVDTDPGYGANVAANGGKSGWNYDVNGLPISRYADDGQGHVTKYYYDDAGRLTGYDTATTDANGKVSSIRYDAAGHMVGSSTKAVTGQGQVTTTFFDENGKRIGSSLLVSDGDGDSVLTKYDANGAVLSTTATVVTGTREKTITNYDANGKVGSAFVTSTSDDGVIHTANYDANGNLVSSVVATPDSTGNVRTANYDAHGALTGYVTLNFENDGSVALAVYDAFGLKQRNDLLDASGVLAATVFNQNGTSVKTTYHADGSYSVTTDDGAGDVTTINYDPQGVKLGDVWSRGDGSSGTDAFHADGIASGSVTNADGTSSTYVKDAKGRVTTSHYDVDGKMLTGSSVTETDAQGNRQTTNYDATNKKIGDVWSNADGTSGSMTYMGDGSYRTVFNASNGDATTTQHNADGSFSSTLIDHIGNVTTTNFDQNGVKASDTWSKVDGTSGSDIFNTDGSSSGSTAYPSGAHDTYTNDGRGLIVTKTYSAWGGMVRVVSAQTDGQGNVITTFHDTMSNQTWDEWTKIDGSSGEDHFRLDGSSFGTWRRSDGHYGNYSDDGHGTRDEFEYDATNKPVGFFYSYPDGSSYRRATTADGSTVDTYYSSDGSSSVTTDDGNGDDATIDYGSNGSKTGDSWHRADGSHGYNNFVYNEDGSMSGQGFEFDSHDNLIKNSTTIGNSKGDTLTTYYSAAMNWGQAGQSWSKSDGTSGSGDGGYDGNPTVNENGGTFTQHYNILGIVSGDSWTKIDGSYGTDIFNSDDSSSGTAHYADGSYSSYKTNAFGYTESHRYNVKGNDIEDYWRDPDGYYFSETNTYDDTGFMTGDTYFASDDEHGFDIYHPDGTSSGTDYAGSGLVTTYTSDSTHYYWNRSDGMHGSDIRDASGVRTSTTVNPDGSYRVETNDFHGNTTTSQYDENGFKLSYGWRNSDGTNGNDTFTPPAATPVLAHPFTSQTADQAKLFSFAIPTDTFTESVAGDTLTYAVTQVDGAALPSWLAFDADKGVLVGTPSGTDIGTLLLKVTATDSVNGLHKSTVFNLTVNAVEGMPVPNTPIADQSIDQRQQFQFMVPADAFTDTAGNKLSYHVTRDDGSILPSWLTFDSQTGTLSGTPGDDDIGTLNLKLTAADPGGQTASTAFKLTVNYVDRAPVVAQTIDNQATDELKPFTFTLPSDTFTDPDKADTLSYSVTRSDGTALPDWLQFDAKSQILSGTPGDEDVGLLKLKVTATDGSGVSTSTMFELAVNHVNEAPVLNKSISDQAVNEFAPFNFVVPASLFTDANKADTLSLKATLSDGTTLPSWLTYDAATQTLYGTPTHSDIGSINIKITATDNGGLSASTMFNLTVAGTPGKNLTGTAGADKLIGGAGNDTLNGGAGADSMSGGLGDDVYVVDNTGDVVIENPGEGSDTVTSSVNYVLPQNVETLLLSGTGNLTATGNSGYGILVANSGNDTLTGGTGITVLEGGSGNDALRDTSGQGVMLGGVGNDTISGGSQAQFMAGCSGTDSISVGAANFVGAANSGANNVIAFNQGDGQDTLQTIFGTTNTLSLGKGINYANLSFSKNGYDLILNTGGGESVTFKGWYGSWPSHGFSTLQVIEEASSTYDPNSSNALYNKKIEAFDFAKLVSQFDQARAAQANLTSWSLMNGLLDAHLSASDTAAIGGDLAYYYGTKGNLTGLDLAAAVATEQNPQFAKTAQTISAWNAISQSGTNLR